MAVAKSGNVAGIGLDIEPVEPSVYDIIDFVCTPSEMEWLQYKSANSRGYWVKVIFSAKESIFKHCFPLLRRFLDFQDVIVKINTASGHFRAIFLTNKPIPDSIGSCLKGISRPVTSIFLLEHIFMIVDFDLK